VPRDTAAAAAGGARQDGPAGPHHAGECVCVRGEGAGERKVWGWWVGRGSDWEHWGPAPMGSYDTSQLIANSQSLTGTVSIAPQFPSGALLTRALPLLKPGRSISSDLAPFLTPVAYHWQVIVIGLVVGSLFFQLGNSTLQQARSTLGACFLCVMFLSFVSRATRCFSAEDRVCAACSYRMHIAALRVNPTVLPSLSDPLCRKTPAYVKLQLTAARARV
jgi:hypothetical protein